MKRKFSSRKEIGRKPQTETKVRAGEKGGPRALGPDLPGGWRHNWSSAPYKVDIHSCPFRNLLPVQVCIVMKVAVIQTPTVNQLDRSKLEQSGRLYIFIYIFVSFISKDTKGNQEMTNM